jgi:hypothetical protein
MYGRCDAPVKACNDVDELCEQVHVLGSAPHRKYLVGHMIDAVPHPVVVINKCLNMPPGALDCVCMRTSTQINEADHVNNSLMRVTVHLYFGHRTETK